MDDVSFHQELEQLLRRRRHILEPLAERHHGEAHVLEILHQKEALWAAGADFPSAAPVETAPWATWRRSPLTGSPAE